MKCFKSYKLQEKQFPQKLPPWNLALIKGLSTLAKFVLPLVLESIYNNMENNDPPSDDVVFKESQSIWSILLKITISLSLCYFLDILCDYKMQQYQLNLKIQLTKRILQNNILAFTQSKQKTTFHITKNGIDLQKQQKFTQNPLPQFSLDKLYLWTKINDKMPVYIYNYHNSFLSLVFESLNIFGVVVYLYIKLSYSLIFGLVFAVLIMKKIASVTQQMQQIFFNNIKLREKKLQLLKNFFNHLVQYKMTWLDKWIWNKIAQVEKQYQDNIKKIKYLDVWCVSLWRFTSISISSVVIVAFYYLGIKTHQTITASTLIQFLMILTMPLNGLSWNIAGLRNSLRAIRQLKSSVSTLLNKNNGSDQKEIIEEDLQFSGKIVFQKDENFRVEFPNQMRSFQYAFLQKVEVVKGQFISIQGEKQAELMDVLPFLIKNKFSQNFEIGYVEQNCWQIDNILESLCFKQKRILQSDREGYPSLSELMQLFNCHQIPQFSTITAKNLSGGQKMRISLVRAFLNCKVIVINSDLTSLDIKMRENICTSFNYLISKYPLTIFCRNLQLTISDYVTNVRYFRLEQKIEQYFTKQDHKLTKIHICCTQSNQTLRSENRGAKSSFDLKVNMGMNEKLQTSLARLKQHLIQQQQSQNSEACLLGVSLSNGIDNLKWETFTTYYKSKYHLAFLVGIVCATICEHVYQFYMNNYVKIQSIHDGSGLTSQNVSYIIILTFIYAGFLFVRAFYFAVADVEESKRLSEHLDKNIIMNQIQFYQNLTGNITENSQKSQHSPEKIIKPQIPLNLLKISPGINKNKNTEDENKEKGKMSIANKLIYHGTTDIGDICDGYSWKANIFFNNIFTTVSSILIVISQIPFIGLVLIPIVMFTILMNNSYQSESQRLLKIQKKVQQNLLKRVHDIQQGVKYIYLYNKLKCLKQQVYRSVQKQINIEWKLGNLKRKLNAKYKSMMIIFLILIIISSSFVGLYPSTSNLIRQPKNCFEAYIGLSGKCYSQEESSGQNISGDSRNKSGKFAILMNYTITLANFMLFFTVSLGQTATKALSIQRIRPLLSKYNSTKSQQRLTDVQKTLTKIHTSLKNTPLLSQSTPLIAIEDLYFSYHNDQNANQKSRVFEGLKLVLKPNEKIQIKGRSGNGKTTLYKLLCCLYKDTLNTVDYPIHISFSPQHPLILAQSQSVSQNIDPYKILDLGNQLSFKLTQKQGKQDRKEHLKKYIIKQLKEQNRRLSWQNKQVIELLEKPLQTLTYKEKIIVNNLRAWLYGKNGVKIYDEPFWVDSSPDQTYILTTHQRQFKHDKVVFLQNKKLTQK